MVVEGNAVADAIHRFLDASARAALCDPGEEPLLLEAGNFALECRRGALILQAWDAKRNLVRRVLGVESEARGRVVLRVERFGGRAGRLSLLDLDRPGGEQATFEGSRLEFKEVFRRFLGRRFPNYKLAALSTEADLEQSLSPSYPRALLRKGASAWAAIGAPRGAQHAAGVLSFGLIWLDYLRRREPSLAIEGLVLLLPAGLEKSTCLRLLFLDPAKARYQPFAYDQDGADSEIDLQDYGNLDTRLEPCRRRLPGGPDRAVARVGAVEGVETIERPGGELSLRVRGLEFARTRGGRLLFGIETKRPAGASNLSEVERLARELARLRSPAAADTLNPLYLRNPELWLEAQVRHGIEDLDATLLAKPVYGQAPTFAANGRGVLDLLAADRDGRLSVVELKASEDIHLPLQGLDYWMRVKWHAERGEFSKSGYFPGVQLSAGPPRMLLVAPALDFHPTNERVLGYIDPCVEVQRIGVNLEWRKKLRVMFRT
jgi:hypothetical protein